MVKGFKVGFIRGRDSVALRIKADEIDLEFIKFNQSNKKNGCLKIISSMKVEAINVAYIGDDETDLPCCSIFPFSFSFNDSHEDFKKVSRFNIKRKGVEGVITEFIEKLNFFSTNPKI